MSARLRFVLLSLVLALIGMLVLPSSCGESPDRDAVATSETGTPEVATGTVRRSGERVRRRGAEPPGRVSLAVRVVTPDGWNVPDVELALHADGPDEDWTSGRVAASRTDGDGMGQFVVEPGRYSLRAAHPEWFVQGCEVELRTNLIVSLFAGHGQKIPLRFIDADGKPVAGARAWSPDDVVPPLRVSDADGRTVLVRRGGGYPLLYVQAEGFHTSSVPLIGASGFDDAEPIEIVLQRGPDLRVLVTEPDGTPAPDVRVDAFGVRPLTNAEGRVEVPNAYLSPKRAVDATAPDGRRAYVDAFAETGERLTDLTIVLPPGRTIEGRVVRGDTGAPVSGAEIRVADRDDVYVPVATSDREGRFRLERVPGDPGDGVAAMAFASSLAPDDDGWRQEIDLTDGALVLCVVPTMTVTGNVVDGDGSPVYVARVWVEPPGRRHGASADLPDWSTRTFDDGTFTLEGLPAIDGLAVLAQGERTGIAVSPDEWEALPAVAGSTTDLETMVLPRPFDLDPHFVDADGAPIARGIATIYWQTGRRHSPLTIRPIVNGRIQAVDGIPRPWVVLEVAGPDLVPVSLRATKETTEVLVESGCAASGSLRVAGSSAPVAGTWVILTSTEHSAMEKGRRAGAQTGADGSFMIQGLRRGRYSVQVEGRKADVAEVVIDANAVELGTIRVE